MKEGRAVWWSGGWYVWRGEGSDVVGVGWGWEGRGIVKGGAGRGKGGVAREEVERERWGREGCG